jgi:hypothetical protein
MEKVNFFESSNCSERGYRTLQQRWPSRKRMPDREHRRAERGLSRSWKSLDCSPGVSAEARRICLGRKRRPLHRFPLAECRFCRERQPPAGKRRAKVAEHASMRRCATPRAATFSTPVACRTARCETPGAGLACEAEVREHTFRITSPCPKARGGTRRQARRAISLDKPRA